MANFSDQNTKRESGRKVQIGNVAAAKVTTFSWACVMCPEYSICNACSLHENLVQFAMKNGWLEDEAKMSAKLSTQVG